MKQSPVSFINEQEQVPLLVLGIAAIGLPASQIGPVFAGIGVQAERGGNGKGGNMLLVMPSQHGTMEARGFILTKNKFRYGLQNKHNELVSRLNLF